MKRYYNFTVLLFSSIIFIACQTTKSQIQTKKWPINSYNYGQMGELSIPNQVALLSKSGYNGLILKSETNKDFEEFEEYLKVTENTNDFKIDAVFERYKKKNNEKRRERWKLVVDRISGKDIQLWMIFSRGFEDAFIEEKLREIVAYATPKKVEVIVYPHSGTYFESSEEALVFVDKIDHPNLNLAFHLYHEVRANNGLRIPDVLKNVKHRLGAVTLAGTDSIADISSKVARDTSTIKPIGKGNYNMKKFVKLLSNSGYKGSVGFMNFKLKEPKKYLQQSKTKWNSYLKENFNQ